jgi:hypothetical protein
MKGEALETLFILSQTKPEKQLYTKPHKIKREKRNT